MISSGQAGGSGAAISIGTLLDNVPEPIIHGISMALGSAINAAFLVAVFVSNLTEGVAGKINLQSFRSCNERLAETGQTIKSTQEGRWYNQQILI